MAKHKRFGWTQIGGDMNPGTYGAIIARCDGDIIELRQIQPTREYVGDNEAAAIGFPFWTREASYRIEDLTTRSDFAGACDYAGLDLDTVDAEDRPLVIAEILLTYGTDVEEGPCGWAKDVVPDRVKWWGSKRARGWRYLADEDADFRREVLEGSER